MRLKDAVRALLLLVIPVAAFVIGAALMSQQSGRNDLPAGFCQAVARDCVPLNRRWTYDVASAATYWTAIGENGRAVEARFLQLDLGFPLLYGGTLLFALLSARKRYDRTLSRGWLAAPVLMGIAFDWLENALHMDQLARFMPGKAEVLDAMSICVASVATLLKLSMLGAAYFALAVLGALLLWRAFGPRKA